MIAPAMPKKRREPVNPWPGRLVAIRDAEGAKLKPPRRLKQSEAAARIGVSRRSWIAWETGDQVPSNAYARLIALTFRIELD
jgi:DNA-binding XRE family transcriptional regulator